MLEVCSSQVEMANVSPKEFDENEIDYGLMELGEQLLEIYQSEFEGEGFRHQYHLLSEVILKLDGEQLDNIPRNLKRFTEYYFKYRDRDEEMILS